MVRLAIAGAAHSHVDYVLDELPRLASLQLVGVSDRSPERASRCADPFGAPVFTDHTDLLAATTPDVVVVAGEYGDRGAVVVAALEAGAHVVADKPLCTTLAQLDAISEASRRSGKTVSLLLEKRYYPETLAALELLARGDLGRIVGVTSSGPHKLNQTSRPGWFFDRASYGGLLNDLAVHDIDLALLFSGSTSGTVTGWLTAPLTDHPGFHRYATATLSSAEVLIGVDVNWLTPAASTVHGDYQMRLVGVHGVADLFWARHRVTVTTDTQPTHDLELPLGRRPAEPTLTALAEGRLPAITTSDSLLATRLALLAQLSADNAGTSYPWST